MEKPTKGAKKFSFLLTTAVMALIFVTGFVSLPAKRTAFTDGSSIISIDMEALIKRVARLNEKKEHQKAIDLLLEVAHQQNEDPVVKALLTQTFDLFLEEEIKFSQLAIKNNPSNANNYHRLAGALELMGDDFRAQEILLNGLRQKNKAAILWMKVAKLELKAGRLMEAFDVFKEVIRLDSKNSDAFNNAAFILAKAETSTKDDLKEAEVLAKTALKLNPVNPEYLDTLAEVNIRKGDLKAAKVYIEHAIKLQPKNENYKNQLKRISDNLSTIRVNPN